MNDLEPRRIIQIAAIPATEDQYGMVYSLCDDGSIWCKRVGDEDCEKQWFRVHGWIPHRETQKSIVIHLEESGPSK